MDALGGQLTSGPIQISWEISIEPDPRWWLWCIDDRDSHIGKCSSWTWTRTRSDRPMSLCYQEFHGNESKQIAEHSRWNNAWMNKLGESERMALISEQFEDMNPMSTASAVSHHHDQQDVIEHWKSYKVVPESPLATQWVMVMRA